MYDAAEQLETLEVSERHHGPAAKWIWSQSELSNVNVFRGTNIAKPYH